MGFVRKVFGIVAAQLICTILVTAFVMSNPGLKLILQTSKNFSFFSFLATMGTLVALLANRKKSPLNMQLLAAFVSDRSSTLTRRPASAPPPKRSAPIPNPNCSMLCGLQLTTFLIVRDTCAISCRPCSSRSPWPPSCHFTTRSWCSRFEDLTFPPSQHMSGHCSLAGARIIGGSLVHVIACHPHTLF